MTEQSGSVGKPYKITIEPSRLWRGRFSFFINGERYGTGPNRTAAKRAAKEMVETMQRNCAKAGK